jgi:hypothetical protein
MQFVEYNWQAEKQMPSSFVRLFSGPAPPSLISFASSPIHHAMQSVSSHGDSALHGFCRVATNASPNDDPIAHGRNGGSLWVQGLQTSGRRSSSRKAHCRDFGGEGHPNGSSQVRLSGELIVKFIVGTLASLRG